MAKTKNNKCIDCSRLISDGAKRCVFCNSKLPLSPAFLANRPWNKGISYGKQVSICVSCHKPKGKTYSQRCKKCSYKGVAKPWLRAEKHPRWKNGVTPYNKMQRLLFRDTMQKKVFERDNYTCQMCGTRGENLQVDHIQSWVDYVELRFNMDNCRTLCAECHYKITFGKPMPENVKAWGHNIKHLQKEGVLYTEKKRKN